MERPRSGVRKEFSLITKGCSWLLSSWKMAVISSDYTQKEPTLHITQRFPESYLTPKKNKQKIKKGKLAVLKYGRFNENGKLSHLQ